MEVRRGIAVAPGVAIGSAFVLGAENFRIPQRFVKIDAIETELTRFRTAIAALCQEIELNEQLATERLGKQYAAIFSAHRQMAQDPKLLNEIEELIRGKCYSPEFAASRVLRQYAKTIQNLGDNYLAERAADLYDLEKRLLKQLLGERREELSNLTQPVIVLANNLTPSETASIDTKYVLGFATEAGGRTSHTAILAGALEIPAVVGLGSFLSSVSGGETVIIDGTLGTVIIDPDEGTLSLYRETAEKFHTVEVQRESLTQVRPETKDGVYIRLAGNIEFPEEVEHCTHRGAEGIGLYRTEFLYLGRDQPPSEEDHYQAYARVVAAFPDRPVVIRTLDLGSDKVPDSMQSVFQDSANPALGLRSLRISLQNLALFKIQLRAISRAATLGDVWVMFPLVTSLLELRQARMILGDVMDDLDEHGVPFRRDLKIGMMVEVPSAALLAEEFAREVDFFSIGTNDLIQYTLAVDRANPAVANLYSSADPSILRLIRNVVEAGARHNIPVNVCGQMSSDPVYTALLVGLGLRNLSATPQTIPEIKQVIRSLTIPQAQDIAQHASGLDVAREVEAYLRGELKKLCSDIVV